MSSQHLYSVVCQFISKARGNRNNDKLTAWRKRQKKRKTETEGRFKLRSQPIKAVGVTKKNRALTKTWVES